MVFGTARNTQVALAITSTASQSVWRRNPVRLIIGMEGFHSLADETASGRRAN
jgi:hypothetical protein